MQPSFLFSIVAMELAAALQSGLDDSKPSIFGLQPPSPSPPAPPAPNAGPEILSEQQLSALIPPSLRYLLVLATHRRPRYLLRALNAFDELYALLALLVERHYLRTHGGGFVEHFYGLRRERALRLPGAAAAAPRTRLLAPDQLRAVTALRDADVWRNLLVMVGVPYLKRKLDEAYAVQVPQSALVGRRFQNALPSNATLRQRVAFCYKWFLRNVYPSLNAAYHFAFLAFQLAYLFSNTAYASPLLWLVRTRVRRLDAADYRAVERAAQKAAAAASSPGAAPRSRLSPRTLATAAYARALAGLQLALPASIFALKFLEWWHASDFARQLSQRVADARALSPPTVSGLPERETRKKEQARGGGDWDLTEKAPVSTAEPTADAQTRDTKPRKTKPPIGATSRLPILTVPAPTAATSALCPICLKDVVNPTAAQTGFVYCYTCIFRWVDGAHERQEAWMKGGSGGEGWGDEDAESDDADREQVVMKGAKDASREGKWESGKGRCAVTGRRLLGGTGGLRRIII